MRIGIDASRANSQKRTGVENYAFFVIEELKKIIPAEHEVVLYSREALRGPLAQLPKNWTVRVLRMPFGRFWTQVRLSLELFLHPPDVFFVVAHVMPLVHPKKTIAVIHDVAPMRFPESYSWFERWYARFATRFALKRAWKIVVPSQFTKKEMLVLFAGADAREQDMVVIRLGYDHAQFHLQRSVAQSESVLARLGITKPYFLYVGRLEEKKDVGTLIRAYDELVSSYRDAVPQLVLAGKPGFGYEHIRAAIDASHNRAGIIELGYVDDADLPDVYREAQVFVFATKYEGFGIPVLEAAACGTPVIIRKGNATEEIANEIALSTDGTMQSITQALAQSMGAEGERRKHRAQEIAATTQAYRWEKTAQEIARLIL